MLITLSYFIPSSRFFLGTNKGVMHVCYRTHRLRWTQQLETSQKKAETRYSLCRKSHLDVIFRGPSERKKKSIGPKNRWKARKARPLSRETSFTFIPSRESEQFHAMRSFCARCIVIVDALVETNDHANHPQNDDPLSSISIVFQSD